MLIQFSSDLLTRIPAVTFGMATVNNVHVSASDERLWQQVEAQGQALSQQFSLDKLSEQPRITSVRSMQKSFGFDPTRYRPSSEALLRRILKGQGLHQINTAVDVNNFCSLEFGLPMCVYDLQHARGAVTVRIAPSDTNYPGIGRQTFQVGNKVIIADDEGVMGTTVSDSERTRVTTETTQLLIVIYAPAGSDRATIQRYALIAAQRMMEFNGGQVSDIAASSVQECL
jgi:DNA/RNA-binding domain of Phe-tRNA-synthetase-like protein